MSSAIVRLYYAIRCWINQPVVYEDLQDGGDWWYVMCEHCHRQVEVAHPRWLEGGRP